MKNTISRLCLTCNQALLGRSDKKYCDDQCRNRFHNQKNGHSSAYMKSVNHTLRKNRLILLSLYEKGHLQVSRQTLGQFQFSFEFYTNIITNTHGNDYIFCYELGYLPLESGYFALVVKKNILDGQQME